MRGAECSNAAGFLGHFELNIVDAGRRHGVVAQPAQLRNGQAEGGSQVGGGLQQGQSGGTQLVGVAGPLAQ